MSSFTWKERYYTLSSKFPCAGSDFTHWNLQGRYPLYVSWKLHLCVLWECSRLLFSDQCYRILENMKTERMKECAIILLKLSTVTMTEVGKLYLMLWKLHFFMHEVIQWEKMTFVNVLKILSPLSSRLKGPHQYY